MATIFETVELTPNITAATGVHLDGFYAESVARNVEDAYDDFLQDITMRGYRVIDSGLTVDTSADPPVSGWVLYEVER